MKFDFNWFVNQINLLKRAVRKIENSGGSGGGGTGDYIPLTGTEEGKPVTGYLNFDYFDAGDGENNGYFQIYNDNESTYSSLFFNQDGGQVSFISSNKDTGKSSSLTVNPNDAIQIQADISTSGLYSSYYYGANYDNNTYIQKLYADKQHSYSTTEYKTGGKWIDNKDIYKITKLTASLLPTVDTMIKSTVVGGTYTEYEYTKP